MQNSEMTTLYHGSKSGIRGSIAPIRRERCDLARAFIWELIALSRLP